MINDPSVAMQELNNSDMNAAPRPPHPGLAEALEILQSLSPRPKISKRTARKRKMESAAVITSSPYNIALQEKQQTGLKPKNVNLSKKSSSKRKDNGKKKIQSTLSSNETPCLYCNEPYCDSVEGFVQCVSCSL